jgi:PAS domain S-box-containing protein
MNGHDRDRSGSPQILVVDDTPASLSLLTEILAERGYQVRSAASGRLALRSAAVEAPDLILLDVRMPDLNGYEVCRRLKEDPGLKEIPVIFISALDATDDKIKGFKAGGVDYITKPFQSIEILTRVETQLGMQGLRKQLEAQNIQLQKLNDRLEQKVEERTAALDQNRQLLQAIINNSNAVIYVKDLEGRYLLINRRFEELFHFDREEIVGKNDYEIFPGKTADDFRAVDQRVLAAGTVLEVEEVAPHDDGPHTYISIKSPLSDTKGVPYAVCGISTDITRRKRDENEIRRLNAELEQKMALLQEAQEELVRKEKLAILGQLSGSVGHELRNPLGVMSNAVYFLKMVLSEADETVREYLGIIKHEIDNSQRIITDLLDFARTKPPRTKRIAVSELIEQSLGRCAVPDNVEHRVEIARTLPALWVDPLQTGQVLQNLITNAVQAMPRGGSLRIGAKSVRCAMFDVRCFEGNNVERRTSNVAPDGDFIEISVEDSGEGITPENLKKLFQPLFTTKPKGIGLGLVVCKNLAAANGGRIGVESRLGEGTTFSVLLPVEEGDK